MKCHENIHNPDILIEQIIKVSKAKGFVNIHLDPAGILVIEHDIKKGRKNYLIASGFHGDEPAGPWGILSFLKNFKPNSLKTNLTIIPLISPTGLRKGKRMNFWEENPNRGYTNGKASHEGKTLLSFLSFIVERAKDGYLSLHEDIDENGFYIYSVDRRIFPSKTTHRIFKTGEKQFGVSSNIDKIIINDLDDTSLETRLFKEGVKYCLTTETPGQRDFATRVKANENIIKEFIKER